MFEIALVSSVQQMSERSRRFFSCVLACSFQPICIHSSALSHLISSCFLSFLCYISCPSAIYRFLLTFVIFGDLVSAKIWLNKPCSIDKRPGFNANQLQGRWVLWLEGCSQGISLARTTSSRQFSNSFT